MTFVRRGFLYSQCLALWLSSACASHYAIDPTFGVINRDIFTAQVQPRNNREVAPLKALEAVRILNTYHNTLGDDPYATNQVSSGSSSRSSSPMSSMLSH